MKAKRLTATRTATSILSIFLVALTGLFFILFGDIYLKATSVELFLGILFPIASVVMFILAESFRHKPGLFIFLKILGVIFGAAFIYFMIRFMGTDTYVKSKTFLKLFKKYDGKTITFFESAKFQDAMNIPFEKQGLYIGAIVLAGIGAVSQLVNTIINAVIGID